MAKKIKTIPEEKKVLTPEELEVQKEELDLINDLQLEKQVSKIQKNKKVRNINENNDAELDVNIEVGEDTTYIKDNVELEDDKTDKKDLKQTEKFYEEVQKFTLNEIRTIKRHSKQSNEDQESETEELIQEDDNLKQDNKNNQVIEETIKRLSKAAKQWDEWLKYQRMSPETFLEKYPTHKMAHVIKEIIEFYKQ